MNIPYRVAEKILLEIPDSEKRDDFSTETKAVFKIGAIVIAIPTNNVDYEYFADILVNQLGMGWWLVDHIFGENGIR